MNKIITVYIKGTEYNKMLKWNSAEEFWDAVSQNKGLPKPDDIITEAYIDDNMVDAGNTWKCVLEKFRMILV